MFPLELELHAVASHLMCVLGPLEELHVFLKLLSHLANNNLKFVFLASDLYLTVVSFCVILSAQLETSFEEVENHLLHLEDLCGQCELERHKHAQSQHLENYKKSKR